MQLYKQGGGKISKTDTTKPDLRSGLVGHWTFDGADTTVTLAKDKSGYGNDGTRGGATTIQQGKIGQGMKFDGTSGYIKTPSSTLYNFTNLSFAAWVYITAGQNTGANFVVGRDSFYRARNKICGCA